ncbi:ATP-binding protein [Enterococcus casseliflavus]|nr:ATP-binding protein [Enterococcus casseliflavus]
MSNNIYVLVGLPATGKTTIAEKLSQNGFFNISSDSLRETFADFKDNHEFIFSIMNYISYRASLITNVVYDSTNLSLKNRKNTYNFFKENNPSVKVHCVLLDYGSEFSKENSMKRTHRNDVTEELIDLLDMEYSEPIVGIDCDNLIIVPNNKRDLILDLIKEEK